MADHDEGERSPVAAGDFSAWLVDIRAAISGDGGADVPCGGCTACCMSSQFVHIAPDETDTLAHIPTGLLFPAPRLPRGHVLMGYDQRGHCPMLVDNRCSIYEHRPRTCRTYDCRVFAAAGIEPDNDKVLIAQRVREWQFSYSNASGRQQHQAVRAAAAYLAEHSNGAASASATGLALSAIEAHDRFIHGDHRGEANSPSSIST
jgi:Fe-S-cluster containining protein